MDGPSRTNYERHSIHASRSAMKKSQRFVLRTPTGDEPVAAETPGAVLSRALNFAARAEGPGVWEVIEHEDTLYRVHRLDSPKLDVRVEVM